MGCHDRWTRVTGTRATPRVRVLLLATLGLGSVVHLHCDRPPSSPPTVWEALPASDGANDPRSLRSGEHHRYEVALQAGDALRFTVEQQDIDLDVTLRDPDGATLVVVDGLTVNQGSETVTVVARVGGRHQVDLRPLPTASPVAGHYRLVVGEIQPATDADRARFAGLLAWGEGEQANPKQPDVARAAYERALDHWRRAGDDPVAECRCLRRLGELRARAGDLIGALPMLEDARALCRDHAHPLERVSMLNRLGTTYYQAGEHQRAKAVLEPALVLARETGRSASIASTRNNLAVVQHATGDLQGALSGYAEAESLRLAEGKMDSVATARHNLGLVYGSLGRFDDAVKLLERALAARGDGTRNPTAWASTARALGSALTDAGRARDALALFDQALQVSDLDADQGLAHDFRARTHLALGDLDAARSDAEEALRIAALGDARPSEAHALLTLGLVEIAAHRWSEARARLRQAAALFHAQGNANARAEVLVAEARAARGAGDVAAAARKLDAALAVVDTVRDGMAATRLRTDFQERRFDVYDAAMDLWLDLAFANDDGAAAVRAFEISERARGRSLLAGASDVVTADERILQARLERLQDRRFALVRAGDADAAAALDVETTAILRTLEQRAETTRLPGDAGFAPLSLDHVRRDVLDHDTALLSYALGDTRGVLWLITRDRFAFFALPSRAIVEAAARRAHARLSGSPDPLGDGAVREVLDQLSDMLLAPARDALDVRQLLIVADGALHYMPFGVLPSPTQPGQPLVEIHDLALAPSASVLAWTRARAAVRPRPEGDLAVFGDPVFNDDDPRLGAVTHGTGDATREGDPIHGGGPMRAPRSGPVVRLQASGREAEAIFALADPARSRRYLGFDATRDAFLDPSLAGFRLVHIATHGLLDTDQPELSGLIFALRDPNGQPRDGLVQALAISRHHLPADLVVLSACRTGLGKEARGEGLIGLPHAFLGAGASQVVISHWPVSDHATAELMIRFHRALRRDGLGPAAALRQAQRAIRSETAWQAPYYWAGFSVIGDGRPFLVD